jgi:hypothetical protein
MWGTRDYYRARRYYGALVYGFEYGVAERLGRKLARYFASSGKRFYVYPIKRRKWESLHVSSSAKKLIDSIKYGVLLGLKDAGIIESIWGHNDEVFVDRGVNEIRIACFSGCTPSVRQSVFDLLYELDNEHINRTHEH